MNTINEISKKITFGLIVLMVVWCMFSITIVPASFIRIDRLEREKAELQEQLDNPVKKDHTKLLRLMHQDGTLIYADDIFKDFDYSKVDYKTVDGIHCQHGRSIRANADCCRNFHMILVQKQLHVEECWSNNVGSKRCWCFDTGLKKDGTYVENYEKMIKEKVANYNLQYQLELDDIPDLNGEER